MRTIRLMIIAAMVGIMFGSIASAETIDTMFGTITVTEGNVAYGEVGTLVQNNTFSLSCAGIGSSYCYGLSPQQVQEVGSTLDHWWIQSGTGLITWQLETAVSAVLGFPGNDHGPLPMENMEYVMQASNDLVNWDDGTLTAVYRLGWDATNPVLPGGLYDHYATRWDFNDRFNYFRTVATRFVVNGWGDTDPEMDGIAAAVPEPSTMLLLGAGLAGLVALRRRFN